MRSFLGWEIECRAFLLFLNMGFNGVWGCLGLCLLLYFLG